MSSFLQTLSELERRYDELEHLMADPAIATDPTKLAELGRERAELEEVVAAYREYRATERPDRRGRELLAGDERPRDGRAGRRTRLQDPARRSATS